MATKCSWLFNNVGFSPAGKVFGFSETWWSADSGDLLLGKMDSLSALRRLVLARGTEIIGYRIGVQPGRSFVVRRNFSAPGRNDVGNVPVDAALCEVAAANAAQTRKRFFIHDLPDDFISDQEINASAKARIANVINGYSALGFQVRTVVGTAPNAPILSIDSLGVVTTSAPIAVAVGNLVQFLKCRDINNKTVRGQYIVTTIIDATSFTIRHWTGQTVARSGTARLVQYAYVGCISFGLNSVISGASRKVGRPFFQSRGRAPVRR